jgi:hypothetical protein
MTNVRLGLVPGVPKPLGGRSLADIQARKGLKMKSEDMKGRQLSLTGTLKTPQWMKMPNCVT